MKKICARLLSLVLCFSLCAVASAEEDWTVFVYLCGSDLESESGLATVNMQQMIDAETASGIRFVVQTGGASCWFNDADPDALDRYVITEGECRLADRQPFG